MPRLFLLLLAVSACTTVPVAGEPEQPKELDEIFTLEQRRSLGAGRLVLLALTANDPAVRARGLLALGRIQDPEALDAVAKGLTDPDPGARLEAAFAAQLFGLSWQPLSAQQKTALGQALLAAESEEDDLEIRVVMLDAMGRVATPETLTRLVAVVAMTETSNALRARAAVSLGASVKALKTELPEEAFAVLPKFIHPDSVQAVRFGAGYAMAMAKRPSSRLALVECAHDESPEVRAVCVRGLAEVGTDDDVTPLRDLLDDADYRVSVEATRALAKLALKCKPADCSALLALDDLSVRVDRLLRGDLIGGAQPLLALAQQGLPPAGRSVLVTLRKQLADGFEALKVQSEQADVGNIDCRLAAALDRQTGSVTESLSCGFGKVAEARRLAVALQELSHGAPPTDPAKRVAEVKGYLSNPSAKVRVAALDVLAATESPLAVEPVRGQLAHEDVVVAVSAAAVAGALHDRASIPAVRALMQRAKPDLAAPLADALADLDAKEAIPDIEKWLASPHLNVRLGAAAALTKLTGKTVVAPRFEGPPAHKAATLAAGSETKLKVRTGRGDFEITLDLARAPMTSANMLALAKKGFFNTLTFHRIVPDFVAQGGDPRGDGEGGPGYQIRCELNRHPYARAAVGMALSGKDTGGSQFFVTTAAAPHLEGRYTVFGDVTAGQEVVDALIEDDLILEVTAVK